MHAVQLKLHVLQEIRRIWVGYLSSCDQSLGQRVAQRLQKAGAL